jgi:hypothetical protein
LAWGQTDFDKLVLKDGTTYFGEYSKTEGKIVYFKPHDALGFQPVPVKLIKQLQLKDGQIIIVGGKVKNSLTLEEYQKLSTKEKAIYDAKLINLWHWALYAPLSGVNIAGFMFLAQGEAWEEDVSIPASLAISYLILNLKKVEFSYPESLANEYDRLYYKKVYYKNINKRKTNIIMASSAITVGVGTLLFLLAMRNFSMGDGGDYNGHTPW